MANEDFIQKHEKRGKYILTTLIIVNLIFFLCLLILSFAYGTFSNLLGFLIMIVLCGFIYYGKQVAKWIYIIFAGFDALNFFFSILLGKLDLILALITFIILAPSIVTCLVLLFSSSVKEYMYKQSN